MRGVLILTVISYLVALPADAQTVDSVKTLTAINTPVEAVKRALEYTGFQFDTNGSGQIHLIYLNDSTTPFLGQYAVNRSAWRVTFEDVQLRDYSSSERELVSRMFDVYIDSATGHFLKAISRTGPLDPDSLPELSAAECEKQLRPREQYVGFPNDPPRADLANALSQCFYNPARAKEVLAQYVLLKGPYDPPRPVWVITLLGIPRVQFHGGPTDWVPIYQVNRMRLVLDEKFGNVLIADTRPTVPMKPEDRARLFPRQDSVNNESLIDK